MKTENDFLEWLTNASIHTNFCRYGQFGGHGFVCVADFTENTILSKAVGDLGGGDIEALDAETYIRKATSFFGYNKDPSKAMHILVHELRFYYFNVLNKKTKTVLKENE